MRGGDVDLDDDEIGAVVQIEPFDVLVLDLDVSICVEVCGERREAEAAGRANT